MRTYDGRITAEPGVPSSTEALTWTTLRGRKTTVKKSSNVAAFTSYHIHSGSLVLPGERSGHRRGVRGDALCDFSLNAGGISTESVPLVTLHSGLVFSKTPLKVHLRLYTDAMQRIQRQGERVKKATRENEKQLGRIFQDVGSEFRGQGCAFLSIKVADVVSSPRTGGRAAVRGSSSPPQLRGGADYARRVSLPRVN